MPNLTAEEHRLNLAFHVFFQNDENNITEYIRNIDGGQWTSNVLIDLWACTSDVKWDYLPVGVSS